MWSILASYTKLCSVSGEFKQTNHNCLPSKISQSVYVEWRTCDSMVNNCFSESEERSNRNKEIIRSYGH